MTAISGFSIHLHYCKYNIIFTHFFRYEGFIVKSKLNYLDVACTFPEQHDVHDGQNGEFIRLFKVESNNPRRRTGWGIDTYKIFSKIIDIEIIFVIFFVVFFVFFFVLFFVLIIYYFCIIFSLSLSLSLWCSTL